MRKIFISILITTILLTQTGCKKYIQGSAEIDKLKFVRAVGIDKSTSKEGYIDITIISKLTSSKSNEKSGENKSELIYSEGRTMFEALRNISTYSDKRPYMGHNEFNIIGEEAAIDGIGKYIDLFSRDHENRLNYKVFVVEGNSAREVIEKATSKDLSIVDKLEGLVKLQGAQSISYPKQIVEVMYTLDSGYTSLSIPCIKLIKNTKDTEKIDVKMGGFAVFNGDKLAGFLDDKEARGLNWIMGRVNTGVIVVKSLDGSNISLEIINTNVKKTPKIENGKITFTIKISMSSNVGEIQTTEDIFNSKSFEYLNIQQQQVIKDEVESVIKYAQESGLDFLNTGNVIYHKEPILWQDYYEKNWKVEFPKVKFNVIIESKINMTYGTKQSSGSRVNE